MNNREMLLTIEDIIILLGYLTHGAETYSELIKNIKDTAPRSLEIAQSDEEEEELINLINYYYDALQGIEAIREMLDVYEESIVSLGVLEEYNTIE